MRTFETVVYNVPGKLNADKELKTPAQKRKKHHEGKISEKAVPVYISEYQHQ
jgi:hypothetical protein